MNWKDIVVGSLATLAVTVVGGVAVYYATKEPTLKPAEDLYYSVKSTNQFAGDKQNVSFSTIDLGNSGDLAASNVVATIKFTAGSIQDIQVDAPQGPGIEQAVKGSEVIFQFPRLLPREVVTVNFLTTGPGKPVVGLRSDDSLGKAKVWAPIIEVKTSGGGKLNRVSELLVPLSSGMFALVVLWAYRKFRKSKVRFTDGMVADKNNAAFTLLHSNLVSDAAQILLASIKSGRYDSFTFSNLALCEKLSGNDDRSARFMEAANFGVQSEHAEAVVAFNEAIIGLLDDDLEKFSGRLSHAYSLSKAEIKRYVETSAHFKEFRRDPALSRLISDAEASVVEKV